MLELISFSLICYGFTNIVVTSFLMRPVREIGKNIFPHLGELLNCSMCFGFWAGLIVSLLGHHISSVPGFGPILDGFISSGICWLLIGEQVHDEESA